jgi:hypothetical protein
MDYVFEFPVDYSGVDERFRFERDLRKVESSITKLEWIDKFKVLVSASKELDINEIHRKLWKETGDDFTYPFVGYVAKVK